MDHAEWMACRKTIDRPDLLDNTTFWAIHLTQEQMEDPHLEECFGVSWNDVTRFYKKEMKDFVPRKPTLIPCYSVTLPLRGRCSVSVEYQAMREDWGIAYLLHHPDWSEHLQIMRRPAAYDWPCFTWSEVKILSGAVQDANLGRAALPLLFPGVWLTSKDDSEDVRQRLRSACDGLNVVRPGRMDDVLTLMENNQKRSSPWRYDAKHGWVNRGWSRRNPEHSTAAFLMKVREFFAAAIVDPAWQSTTVVSLAKAIRRQRAFHRMPILADALQESGCRDTAILGYCREPASHVVGRWVVDLLLAGENKS